MMWSINKIVWTLVYYHQHVFWVMYNGQMLLGEGKLVKIRKRANVGHAYPELINIILTNNSTKDLAIKQQLFLVGK